jgi:hypothetical protein
LKDIQFTDVHQLASLVLEDLPQLSHLTMNNAALESFDINKIGGRSAGNSSLYIDLSDVMAPGTAFSIDATNEKLATSCLGVRLNETSAMGAVETVFLRGLRHPTGISLERLHALNTLTIADCELAWFDAQHIGGSEEGFDIEITNTSFNVQSVYFANKRQRLQVGRRQRCRGSSQESVGHIIQPVSKACDLWDVRFDIARCFGRSKHI